MPPADEKPFLLPQVAECRTTLCPSCGRAAGGEQQAFLNLEGVLTGDIPPSAAVGFGFRALGGRPVANANIVKNLGLRDPKTGLLPGQKAKVAGPGAPGATVDGGGESAQVPGEGAEISFLNMFGPDVSLDTEGPATPSPSIKEDDSHEDLVQLYMNSGEDSPAPSVHEGHVEEHEHAL